MRVHTFNVILPNAEQFNELKHTCKGKGKVQFIPFLGPNSENCQHIPNNGTNAARRPYLHFNGECCLSK